MKNKIAIQGELGAYSHLAATKIFKNTKVIACKTFEDVFKQCKKNKEVISVIPIENSLAGRVADIHYLLPKYKLKIVGEYYLPVEHCCWNGVTPSTEGIAFFSWITWCCYCCIIILCDRCNC